MSDIILEIIRATIVGILFIQLIIMGRKEKICQQDGWCFIIGGFGLIFIGSAIDITDNFSTLGKYIIIGDTPIQAFIETLIGYLLGFLFLAIGLFKFLPTVITLQKTKKELADSYALLEERVKERTVSLEKQIAERKQFEIALRDSEERLRHLSEATMEGVVLSRDLKIIASNRVFAEMFGYNYNEVAGMKLSDMLTPESFTIVSNNIKSDYDKPYEVTGTKKDGSHFPIKCFGKTISYHGQNVRQTAVRNMTIPKQRQAELIQQEKLQGVLEMAGAVCHELNQPMMAIMGYLDFISDGLKDNDELKEYLVKLNKQTMRMADITRKLMNITRYASKDYLPGTKIIDIDESAKK